MLLQKLLKFQNTSLLVQKFRYIILLLMIGGSLQATPVVIKGLVTNNSVPATRTWVRVQCTQLGDTAVMTDTLGNYEVTINPRLIRGSVTASFIDTCRRDSIGDTKPFDTSTTPTIIINLNGCIPSGLTLGGFVQNIPNPYTNPVHVLYSFNQFQSQDTLEVDSTGSYSKTIQRTTPGLLEYRLIDCNSILIQDSIFYNVQDTIIKNFDYCAVPINSYFGIVRLNGAPTSPNQCALLLYEYNVADQAMTFKDTVRINSGGRFSFPNNSGSDYLLKVVPTSNQQGFSATYYPSGYSWAKNSLVIGPHLSDSTALIIDLNQNQSNQNGNGIIAGELRVDDNLNVLGYNGTGIHLLDKNERPIDYQFADASGNFRFENLTSGDYYVWFDQCGIPTEPIPVTISNTNEKVDGLIITANQLGISYDNFVSIAPITDDIQHINAYPNPFSRQLKLHGSTNAEVVVFNLYGQPITNFNLTENETRIIDTTAWAEGFYLINVHSKHGDYSIKLLKD